MDTQSDYSAAREQLFNERFRRAGIRDPRVIAAFRDVPLHEFVPPRYRARAYADAPIPIGWGQTMTQPTLIGIMMQALRLTGSERILEIGTGSGFQTALLTRLARSVRSVERLIPLAKQAGRSLSRLGYWNAGLFIGDGSRGLPEYAPYDGIIVGAGSPGIPKPYIDQLHENGRLVLPVGDTEAEQMLIVGIKSQGQLEVTEIGPARFVPLIGSYGWNKRRRS
jgi:protein-L-isoaspartate(D-aspartate) O-methyltransferase